MRSIPPSSSATRATTATAFATTWRSEASNPSSRRDRTATRQSNTIGKPTSGATSSSDASIASSNSGASPPDTRKPRELTFRCYASQQRNSGSKPSTRPSSEEGGPVTLSGGRLSLALLWQIKGAACAVGFPNRVFNDSWVVGFWRADHGTTSDWEGELGRWLKPFLDRLGHKARRQMCPLYVAGLIGPGDRKSVQPMAERLAPGDYDQLHHFVAAGVWDSAPLETELLIQADRLVGSSDAVLVIDDTALPKKGKHSVGVAPQYASALGKNANCQTLVSLTLARGEVPVMLALRLFLPESWTGDRVRLERAGVPVECRTERTKPEIALAEIDRVIAAGVRFGCVLADAGYGLSAPFRQGLTVRGLAWAVRIRGPSQIFYRSRPKTCWPMPSGKM